LVFNAIQVFQSGASSFGPAQGKGAVTFSIAGGIKSLAISLSNNDLKSGSLSASGPLSSELLQEILVLYILQFQHHYEEYKD
jgi:hypothetical protein